MAAEPRDMLLSEFDSRLIETEGPLTAALDSLYGKTWSDAEADALSNAIQAAIAVAREERHADEFADFTMAGGGR